MIDDWVPYNKIKKKIAFCSTYSNNIWAILLEKAFAKVSGSYEDIIRGWATVAFQFLLSSPVSNFFHSGDSKEQLEKLWKKISRRSSSGKYSKIGKGKSKVSKSVLVATCATGWTRKKARKEETKKECKEVGLNFAHAYWILDSYFLEKDKYGIDKDYRILKIK